MNTFLEKLKHNAEVAFKSGSTWVVLIASAFGAVWAGMTEEQRYALFQAFPLLRGWTPVITLLITFLIAKLKPSNAVSSQTQTLLEEIARLRVNAVLKGQGAAEVGPLDPNVIPPAPEPTVTVAALPVKMDPTKVAMAIKSDPTTVSEPFLDANR